MPKDIQDLHFRVLKADEVRKEPSAKRKQLVINEFQKKFIDPETGEPIQVGEAIEVGPFDSVDEGRNWFKYYLPDTYKALGWGKVKTRGNHIKSPLSVEPKPRDAAVYFWIVRVTE